jgi:hypothetical protein
MEGEERTRPAGGFATQRGINYQDRIAAFFGVSCLSESIAVPGLPHSPVQSIRCETGEPLADILLSFENDGIAFVEVKRTIQLTATRMKPVLSQLIQQYIVSEQGTNGGKFPWRRKLDPNQDRMMLLTSSESPENVTKHLAACLSRIGPEAGPEILATVVRNDQEARAFGDFSSWSCNWCLCHPRKWCNSCSPSLLSRGYSNRSSSVLWKQTRPQPSYRIVPLLQAHTKETTLKSPLFSSCIPPSKS